MRPPIFSKLFSARGIACALSCLTLSACTLFATPETEQTPLELHVGDHTQTLQREELLGRAQTITIPDDAAYHAARSYQAVPLRSLLPGLGNTDTLQFTALDGFVANIPASAFQGEAQAWLAVESPSQTWPPLADGKPGAGPYYLVWTNPEKSHISGEQWPYQIAKITQTVPLEIRYPQLQPHASGARQESALRGLQVYTKNCAVCHSLNKGGDAMIGPDLNLPFNPTEYFQEAFLRRLIREPASVRSWKNSVMPSFSEQVLPESELTDLLAYLRQMAAQRN